MHELVLIDDEELIVASIKRILRRSHTVTAFTSSSVALEHLLQRSEAPDLVLCDLSMPEITGIELYDSVLLENPALARSFAFMSGGGGLAQENVFLADKRERYIQKPFNVNELRDFVARTMT